jgi:hypothetical protein
MEAHMVIVDTPHGAAVLDWRGYHKVDKEKLYKRLYGSFVNRLGKPEGGTTAAPGEGNTQKEADNGGTDRG